MLIELLGFKDKSIPDEKLLEAANHVENIEQANNILIWTYIDTFFELFYDLVFMFTVGLLIIGLYLLYEFVKGRKGRRKQYDS
ncbi:hypothetical protein ACOTVS_10040 [Aliarcobacter butzleri]